MTGSFMCPYLTVLGLEISSYKMFYIAAAIVTFVLFRREVVRLGCRTSHLVVLTLGATVFGAVGAKTYFLVANWQEIVGNPGRLLRFGGSGWYGFLVGAGLALIVASRQLRLPVLGTLDAVALPILAGQTVGRIGCLFAGCCHGRSTSLPWAIAFPYGLYSPDIEVHPTQLYEAFGYVLIFVVILRLKSRDTTPGMAVSVYLLAAGGARFMIEFVRINSEVAFGFTLPQFFAAAEFIVGAALMFFTRERAEPVAPKTKAAEPLKNLKSDIP